MSPKSIGLLAALLGAVALPAAADSYTAFTQPGAIVGGFCGGVAGAGNSGTPLAATTVCADGRTASAAAAPGVVHAAAQVSGFNGNIGAQAGFQGVVNFASSSPSDTPVQFVIPLSGFLVHDLGALGPLDFNVDNRVSVNAGLAVQGFGNFGFNRFIDTDRFGTHDLSSISTFTVVGLGVGDSLDLMLISPVMFLPVNTNIIFGLSLQVGVLSDSPNGSAVTDFSHTFGFEVGQTPFILAPGVTANAGDYIVNNVVVAPNASGPGVPEPSAWAMMLLGFGGLGAALRRRRRAVAA
jgi:hypothetical protein